MRNRLFYTALLPLACLILSSCQPDPDPVNSPSEFMISGYSDGSTEEILWPNIPPQTSQPDRVSGRTTEPAGSEESPRSAGTTAARTIPAEPETTRRAVSTSQPPEAPVLKPTSREALIASLTHEDGTGDIHLYQKKADVLRVLDSYGIGYQLEAGGAAARLEDGTVYMLEGNNIFYPRMTRKGVQIGDNAQKIWDVYGKTNLTSYNGAQCYIYTYRADRSVSPGGKVFLTFRVNGSGSGARVTGIDITPQEFSA
ncbi:MAG: hypothetical protein LBJ11_11240 [Oscillospiraceae bacterium]|nr:hypothetical protein [Oscillospiraceae bacterium]